MSLDVRAITAAEHRAYVVSRPSVALEQTPGWGKGFVTARTESVGWFDGTTMVGAGLYRLRGLPRVPMRSVAVFESGPDIDWIGARRRSMTLADWLDPLVDHLRNRGAFTARVSPVVAEQDWWRFDPAARTDSKALVRHAPLPPTRSAQVAAERLNDAGWRLMTTAPRVFSAEVVLADSAAIGRDGPESRALTRGIQVRTGTIDDLPAVHRAVTEAHSSLPQPSLKEWERRWRGLAEDDFAGVTLLVLERDGEVVYGGLYATVGDRAWDLSAPLPQPDADRPEVQLLRYQVMRRSRESGVRTLFVPVVSPQRRAPVKAPAPGWPPVHLAQLVGTWHFPVRATWHGVLSPVVDRLVL